MVVAIAAVLGATTNAEAQFRRGRVIVAPRIVVGGSFFYDPWFDPFYGAYEFQYPIGPYGYPPMYRGYRIDATASVRVEVKPKEAEVYVDGYYAGIVDDFDGMFQRLEVAPGEHEIDLYLDGYRAVHQKVYLSPRNTFRLKYTMERLGSGEQPEPRPQPTNPPPDLQTQPGGQPGQYPPPMRGPSTRRAPMPPPQPRDPRDNPRNTAPAGNGSIAIRVQPADADVMIDGEKWRGPGNGQEPLVVELA